MRQSYGPEQLKAHIHPCPQGTARLVNPAVSRKIEAGIACQVQVLAILFIKQGVDTGTEFPVAVDAVSAVKREHTKACTGAKVFADNATFHIVTPGLSSDQTP